MGEASGLVPAQVIFCGARGIGTLFYFFPPRCISRSRSEQPGPRPSSVTRSTGHAPTQPLGVVRASEDHIMTRPQLRRTNFCPTGDDNKSLAVAPLPKIAFAREEHAK
jgi:hypothetical protein